MSKTASPKAKLLAIGYINKETNEWSLVFPIVLAHLVAIFYEKVDRVSKFDKNRFWVNHSDRDDIQRIAPQGNKRRWLYNYRLLYLTHWINSTSKGIHSWIFKIVRIQQELALGLVTNEDHTNDSVAERFKNNDYPILTSWSNRKHGDLENAYRNHKPLFTGVGMHKYTKYAQDGDTMELILNLKEGTIEYRLTTKTRQEFECIVYNNVAIGDGIKYKMAIQLPHVGDRIINESYTKSS